MKKFALPVVVTAILAIGALSLSSQAFAATNCADILVDTSTYICQFKNDDGSEALDRTFTFTDDDTEDDAFTLSAEGFEAVGDFSCTCDPTNFRNPKFNQTKDFTCVFSAAQPIHFVYRGKAVGKQRIKNGKYANAIGDTAVYECLASD